MHGRSSFPALTAGFGYALPFDQPITGQEMRHSWRPWPSDQ